MEIQKKMNKIYIDWEEFGIMIDKLAKLIKDSGMKFHDIYGIPRGGLPIAVALSHKLNLPLTEIPEGDNLLVVDDISDTGKTLKKFQGSFIAVLYNTEWTISPPTYFVDVKKSKKDWIVFPWELK